MSNSKTIYEVPLYAYMNHDNTWTFFDYIKVENELEPKVVRKIQHSIGWDDKGNPRIKFILYYDVDDINKIHLDSYHVQNFEELYNCGMPTYFEEVNNNSDGTKIVGVVYSVDTKD